MKAVSVHLVLSGSSLSRPTARFPWLKFKHSSEELLRCGGEEADFCIWVQAVQMRRLWGEVEIDVVVVASVVTVGWSGEAGGEHQLSIKLVRVHVLLKIDLGHNTYDMSED